MRAARYASGEVMKRSTSRITVPLVRDSGTLREASWDEALDRAAQGIRESVALHGPTTFGMFSCSKATNEVNYMAQKLVRTAIGSNNIDSCNRT
jgi:predicted molibdopterin-dependent oxidoreductase YjgC